MLILRMDVNRQLAFKSCFSMKYLFCARDIPLLGFLPPSLPLPLNIFLKVCLPLQLSFILFCLHSIPCIRTMALISTNPTPHPPHPPTRVGLFQSQIKADSFSNKCSRSFTQISILCNSSTTSTFKPFNAF